MCIRDSSGAVHAVIDGDKANATLTQDFHNLTDFQIVTTHAAHVLDTQVLHMGRDYLKVGQIMEILRQRGVRLIAINDGVDSARGDDDFTPFRNIMNEYYARDTSRKIRSTRCV